MQEDLDIKISMLLDGELESEEALEIFGRIRNEPDLRAKWLRYNAVSCAFRGQSAVLPDGDFFERISKALEQETHASKPSSFPRKTRLRVPSVAAALAASVALAGVVLWSGISDPLKNPADRIDLAISAQPEPPVGVVPVNSASDRNAAYPRRLNDYLISHNESTYTTGPQAMMPYARVISYSYDR